MSEPGDAALADVGGPNASKAAKDLDDKPIKQHEHSGNLHGGDENKDRYQRKDLCSGKHHQIGTHNASNGSAGAHGGYARTGVGKHLYHSRSQAAKNIKDEVF